MTLPLILLYLLGTVLCWIALLRLWASLHEDLVERTPKPNLYPTDPFAVMVLTFMASFFWPLVVLWFLIYQVTFPAQATEMIGRITGRR